MCVIALALFCLLSMLLGALLEHAVERVYWQRIIGEWQRAWWQQDAVTQRAVMLETTRADANARCAIAIQHKLDEAQDTIAVLYERLLLRPAIRDVAASTTSSPTPSASPEKGERFHVFQR